MVIGIDVGYGMTKAYAGVYKDVPMVAAFPSVYLETTDKYEAEQKRVKGYHHLELDGVCYYVGKFAVAKEATATFDKQDLLRHKLCILTAIASLCDEFSGVVALGLPIGDKNLSKWLSGVKGDYTIKHNGKEKNIKIASVKIYPQGSTVIEELAEFDEDTEYQTIGIVDIGQKTVDVAWYNDGVLTDSKTRSWDDLGCNFVYQEIIKEVNDKLGFQLPDNQVAEYIARKKNIKALAQPFFDKFAKQIEEKLRLSGWNYNQIDRLVLVGGGAYYVADQMKKSINCDDSTCVELHENAAYANAVGFFNKAGGK